MTWTRLVTVGELAQALGITPASDPDVVRDPTILLLDVRHALQDAEAGPAAYRAGHLPGALHAHIDRDLSAPPEEHLGRHPLPDPADFQEVASAWGVDDDVQVVCYDDVGGGWAARAWWLLRHYGHTRVALLDGGLRAWREAGLPLTTKVPRRRRRSFIGKPGHLPVVEADDLLRGRVDAILDARAPSRYAGEEEPIDPVAGHVPGAVNVPFKGNLDDRGRFLPSVTLAARYAPFCDGRRAAVYCGSGVTAAHDVLAAEVAGFDLALYPGSWSQWVADPERPVVRSALPEG